MDLEQFQGAKFSSYLSFLLQSGQPIPYNSDLDKEIEPLAWRRIVELQLVRDLGLTASDEEVISSLASQPFFQTEGKYDPEKYDTFVNRDLVGLLQGRISKDQFETHIREEISIGKLRQMMSQTVLVPPRDMQMAYQLLNDEYNADYFLVTEDLVADSVEVSEEDVRAYFDNSPEAFQRPEKLVVKYVKMGYDDFTDDAEVSQDRIDTYYQENLENYQVMDTNEVTVTASSDTNAPTEDAGLAITYTPVEDVKDEIVATLKLQEARTRAIQRANDFVYTLTPDQFGRAPSFEDTATDMELPIVETPPFSEFDPIEGIESGLAEVKGQALRLYPNPEEYFSNPVESDNAVYVLALVDRIPPAIPEFEEVRDEVEPIARRSAISDAVSAKAGAVKAAIAESENPTESLSEILTTHGLTATETGLFTAREGLADATLGREIRQSVMMLNKGEVSDPIPTREGVLLVFLKEYTAADTSNFAAARDELQNEIRYQYASGHYEGWQEQLLKDAGFEPRADEVPSLEEGAAEEESPEGEEQSS